MGANAWVAAYDPTDRALAPAILLLEVACALARRFGDTSVGREAAAKLEAYSMLSLEPLDSRLLSDAVRLGTTTRLRAADALYAATAARSGDGVLVSWDLELIERAGAVTPPAWLSTHA